MVDNSHWKIRICLHFRIRVVLEAFACLRDVFALWKSGSSYLFFALKSIEKCNLQGADS